MTDYLIWSHEHDAWWKPARRGYTDDVADAGRYPEAEARSILEKSSYGWRKGQLPKEVIVPAGSPDLDMAVVDETERIAYQLAKRDIWYMTGSEAPIHAVSLLDRGAVWLAWTPVQPDDTEGEA